MFELQKRKMTDTMKTIWVDNDNWHYLKREAVFTSETSLYVCVCVFGQLESLWYGSWASTLKVVSNANSTIN